MSKLCLIRSAIIWKERRKAFARGDASSNQDRNVVHVETAGTLHVSPLHMDRRSEGFAQVFSRLVFTFGSTGVQAAENKQAAVWLCCTVKHSCAASVNISRLYLNTQEADNRRRSQDSQTVLSGKDNTLLSHMETFIKQDRNYWYNIIIDLSGYITASSTGPIRSSCSSTSTHLNIE